MILVTLFIFLFGLAVGSFLNVVICRLNTEEKILLSRSRCPYCKKNLKWFDLIPLLSFISTFGRCRYCGKKISWQYPIVEIATGCLFLLIFNFKFLIFNQISNSNFSAFGGPAAGWQYLISNFQFLNFSLLLFIVCSLIVIFVYDLKHYIIPDKIVFPAIIATLIFKLFETFENWNLGFIWDLKIGIWDFKTLLFAISSAIIASSFFLTIIFISKGQWMGMGDVKLAFLMGLLLGWPDILLALFLAFLSGAVIGLILVGLKIKSLKSQIPFGPFLVLATFIMLFFGEFIKNIYPIVF